MLVAKRLRILILGGTRFLGRAIADVCLAHAHDVTLFHRGLSNPGILPEARHIIGDRHHNLDRLRGLSFDVAIDTSAFEVHEVREAAKAIATYNRGLRYVFISSISVYADMARMEESSPLHSVDGAETASLSLEQYGGLKAACERALEEELPKSVLTVRAGLIVGPHDADERFRYWLRRIHRGGEVLAPGAPEASAQLIDVRDLAEWIVRCVEAQTAGTFNAAGQAITLRALLAGIRDTLSSDARFVWVPDEILVAHEVGAYSEMPFWLPKSVGATAVPIERALSHGLAFRPLATTVRDTWSWLDKGWDAEANVRARKRLRLVGGMSEERERQLILAASLRATTRRPDG